MGRSEARFQGPNGLALLSGSRALFSRSVASESDAKTSTKLRAMLFPTRSRRLNNFPPQRRLFGGFACLGRTERHAADDALTFFNKNQLIWLYVFQCIHLPAGPPDFEKVHLVGFPDSKMDAQIIL